MKPLLIELVEITVGAQTNAVSTLHQRLIELVEVTATAPTSVVSTSSTNG